MANKTQDLSRRTFCQGAAASALGAVAFFVLGAKPAAAQTKMTQEAASYQNTPKGTQRCDNCALFVSPDACKMVEGKIDPQGWCSVFTPKV
jgi:secreted PhoX family phosphatase